MAGVPPAVEDLTRSYLRAVDAALPGFVTGLYLVGSVALGAWQPGRSDVDTVTFASRTPTEQDLAALRDLHAALPATPDLDGVYLAPGHGWPADEPVAPFVVEGRLHTDRPCGQLTPVLWLTLRRHGIPVRGPAVAELGIRVDRDELRAYNLNNLRTYWQARATEIRRYVAGLEPTATVDGAAVAWFALGPARLHATLATGEIVGKRAAGEYVVARFPEHAALAERAIRWREGEPVTFTAADLDAAASSIDLVAEDAWRRWGA